MEAHHTQLCSVLCRTQKRPDDPPPEGDEDVNHLEEDKDPSNKEVEIPEVKKAAQQVLGADISLPGSSLPKHQRLKPPQNLQCSTTQHLLQSMEIFPKSDSHLWVLWPFSKGVCLFTPHSSTIHHSKSLLNVRYYLHTGTRARCSYLPCT